MAAVPLDADAVTIGSFSGAAAAATGTAVIIDVFRAFTTAAVALARGAERVVMVDDLGEALALRGRIRGALAMGERGGLRPEGFDFGNSPLDLDGVALAGRTLVQTTSNGTRGIAAARSARRVYAAALANAGATAAVLAAGAPLPVTLVAMGEKDRRRTEEDEVCAMLIRSRLMGRSPDAEAARRLVETASTRSDTRPLSAPELAACLAVDSAPFAIRVRIEDGLCVARPERPPAGD